MEINYKIDEGGKRRPFRRTHMVLKDPTVTIFSFDCLWFLRKRYGLKKKKSPTEKELTG